MKRLLLAAVLAAAASAHAGEVLLHTVSMHGKRTYDLTSTTNVVDEKGNVLSSVDTTEARPYNNVNLGVGYRFDNEAVVGVYHNSYRKAAFYAGYMPMWQTSHAPLSLGFAVLVATGYEIPTGNKITAAATLIAGYKVASETRIYVSHIPKVTSDTVSVTHIMFGREF